MIDCWIHLDEVGTFHPKNLGRSLIGGWFCDKKPTSRQARSVMQAAVKRDTDLPLRYHAVHHNSAVEGHLRLALPLLEDLGWHPVVFSLQQEASLGHPVPTYMHALADGLFTLARHLSKERGDGVKLHVVAASWCSATHREYERIQERLQLERLRRTWTRDDLPVEISVVLEDALSHPALMIADMLMYGLTHLESYGDDVRDRLLEALGPFLFTVLASEDEQRVDELLARRDYGQALIEVLALRSIAQPSAAVEERLIDELGRLAGETYTLEAAFEAAGNRIEFEVSSRQLEVAERQLGGLLEIVDRLEGTVDPHCLARARVRALELQLHIRNHQGAVEQAEEVLQHLRPACAALSGHLESLPLVLDVRCLEGVHRTNCYDFEVWNDLVESAEMVLDLHETMKRLVGGDLEVRSALRGRLLGTALQACTKAARANPALFDAARELSQSAMEEFTLIVDLRRQYGYRCELETDAGSFEEAGQWLRLAAGFQPTLPIADVVAKIADEDALGFNLMHVVRLWAACEFAASSDPSLRPMADHFMRCYSQSITARRELETASAHPWPVIAWMVGRAVGLRPKGNPVIAARYLESALKRLEEVPGELTLQTLALAARCDLLAIVHLQRIEAADVDRVWNATLALAERLAGSPVASLARWFGDWPERLGRLHVARATADRQVLAGELRAMAREVPY